MRRSFLYCPAYENRHGKKEATILHLSVSQRKFEAGMELELGARGAQARLNIAKNPSFGKTKREGNLLEKSIHIFPNSK